jgi:tRNA (Thr-GGU) A37 N-methylase
MEQVKLNMNAASNAVHKSGSEQRPNPPALSNVEVLQERMRSLRLARGL